MKIKNNLFKANILVTLTLVLLVGYRWYLWDIDFRSWTIWSFLTNKGNTGLLWNLFLAWVAVFLGWLVYKSQHRILTKFLSLVWVLWLPNTLYMVTDFKYIGIDDKTSFLHEIVFFSLFCLSGILLYLLSVRLVWLKYRFRKIWFVIITGVAIIGVVAGRVLRWNSWDIFTDPQKILSDLSNLF